MPLSPRVSWSRLCFAPFRWSQSGFVYLGIHITPFFSGLYNANPLPIIRKIKEDMAPLDSFATVPLRKGESCQDGYTSPVIVPFPNDPSSLNKKITFCYKQLFDFLSLEEQASQIETLQCLIKEGVLAVPALRHY